MGTATTYHLLLVDDEEEILQTMSIIFEMNGYTFMKAHNGIEALQLMKNGEGRPFDLIITDIDMPLMNGLELVRECKKISCEIPVLVVTGHGTKNMVVELMREGVSDFIDKPLQMKSLLARTETAITTHKERETARASAVRKQVQSVRREYEERILASQEFELLGKMSCSVIHDFNNVLAGIMGYADFLHERVKGHPYDECGRYAKKILDACTTARRIVDQFQTFKRGGSENFESIDIHQVINEALSMVRVPMRDKVKVLTELRAGNSTISGDRALMHNVFINLLFNARDAIQESGTVRIITEPVAISDLDTNEAGAIIIKISDTGCGMTSDTMHKIFEPFFTTKGTSGNGIGLSSVLSIVEKHDGAISVDSEKGKGSTFTIILPLVQ